MDTQSSLITRHFDNGMPFLCLAYFFLVCRPRRFFGIVILKAVEKKVMNWKLVSIPIISALIGWITNVVAIKMLFWPRQEIRIPIFNWNLQGVIPRRQAEIAKNLGEIVEQQLICIDDIIGEVSSEKVTENLHNSIKQVVLTRVMEKMPTILPDNWRKKLGQTIEDILDREIPKVIDRVMDRMIDHLREDFKIAPIVEEKILAFNIGELEHLFFGIASKEFKLIEILGGVLGLLIGCVQLLIVYLQT